MRRREAQKNIPAKKVSLLASFVAGLLISITLLSPISFSIETSQEAGIAVAVSPEIAFADAAAVAAADESSNLIYKHYCSITKWGGCIVAAVVEIIYTPSAWLLMLGGFIFDIMLGFSLSSKVLDAEFARNGWAVTRDLANMLFIFILLFIAIATILQISSYGAKSLLARLIIIALLLNFSLFITRVVVDVSNVTARLFYDGITAPQSTNLTDPAKELSASRFTGANFDAPPKGISAGLVASFNPGKLISLENFKRWSDEGKGLGTLFFIYLFATAINLVAAWVLISIAMLFVTRVAVIWFLMAVAPLAFIAMILPKTQSWASRWWGELFSKSFSIAVFLFFLWIIAAFTSSGFLKNTFNASASGATGIFETIVLMALQFGVLIVMLLMAKKTTMSMAGSIGGMSLNIGNKLAGGALGLLAGGVGGKVFRSTVGLGARVAANNEKRQAAASAGGFGGWVATQNLRAARAVAGSSGDIRGLGQTKLGKAVTGGVLGKAGGKGGYDASFKKSIERKAEFANYVGESTLEEKERATKSKGLLDTHNAELAKAKKELAEAKLDESKKAIQERINTIQSNIDAEQKIFDTADNAGKLRREAQANKLETSGSGLASYLKRKAGFKATTSDRQAALAARKGKKTVKQLVDEALEASGEAKKEKPKEEATPSASDKGKKGAQEIDGGLAKL